MDFIRWKQRENDKKTAFGPGEKAGKQEKRLGVGLRKAKIDETRSA